MSPWRNTAGNKKIEGEKLELRTSCQDSRQGRRSQQLWECLRVYLTVETNRAFVCSVPFRLIVPQTWFLKLFRATTKPAIGFLFFCARQRFPVFPHFKLVERFFRTWHCYIFSFLALATIGWCEYCCLRFTSVMNGKKFQQETVQGPVSLINVKWFSRTR